MVEKQFSANYRKTWQYTHLHLLLNYRKVLTNTACTHNVSKSEKLRFSLRVLVDQKCKNAARYQPKSFERLCNGNIVLSRFMASMWLLPLRAHSVMHSTSLFPVITHRNARPQLCIRRELLRL